MPKNKSLTKSKNSSIIKKYIILILNIKKTLNYLYLAFIKVIII